MQCLCSKPVRRTIKSGPCCEFSAGISPIFNLCVCYLRYLVVCSSHRLLWLLQMSSSSICPVSNTYWETVGWTQIPSESSNSLTPEPPTCLSVSGPVCLSVIPGLTELMTAVKRAVQNSLGGYVCVTFDYNYNHNQDIWNTMRQTGLCRRLAAENC